MATAQSESLPKGNVADIINRLSRPDLAHKLPISTKPIFSKSSNEMDSSLPLFIASFKYDAQMVDELDLIAGDVIELLEEVEDGWARGRVRRTGKEGLYPTNFVEEKKVSPSISKPPINNNIPSQSISSSTPSTSNTSAVTVTKRASTGEDQPQAIKRTPSISTKKESVEMARVMFTYEAQHDDELSLPTVGVLVKILKKDCGDPGWFMGELNGEKGLFPDNFVELVKISSDQTPIPISSPKPGDKPPAKLPIGLSIGSVAPPTQAPPTVPAKPPKNILTNNTNSNNNNVSSSSASSSIVSGPQSVKPVTSTTKGIGGGVADLKNRLMSQGLFSKGGPGESSMMNKQNTQSSEPIGPLDGESAEEPSQLIHLNKGRPRQPGNRRPMSMFAGKVRGSEDDLINVQSTIGGGGAMSRSTVFPSTHSNKESSSPSRETTFPALSLTRSNEFPPKEKEDKSRDEVRDVKMAIVPPPKSLSTSMHSLSAISSSSNSNTIGNVIKVAGGDKEMKGNWVPRSEFEALQHKVSLLETRLAALERK